MGRSRQKLRSDTASHRSHRINPLMKRRVDIRPRRQRSLDSPAQMLVIDASSSGMDKMLKLRFYPNSRGVWVGELLDDESPLLATTHPATVAAAIFAMDKCSLCVE